MRFTSIQMNYWRNFAKVDSVPLQDRCFIIGPNASGKSNFLDVFRFLGDLSKDGLQKAVEKRGGMKKIRDLWARSKPAVKIACELMDSSGKTWQYLIEIDETNKNKESKPLIVKEMVRVGDEIVLDRPDLTDKEDPEVLFQTHLEQLNMNTKFRGLVEAFKMVRYLHLVPQLIREQGRMEKIKSDPYGSDFLDQILRTPLKLREQRLRKINKIIKIAVPYFEEIHCEKDYLGKPHLKFKYKHWRPQGAWQTETELSDGTIRLIGLIWALLEGEGVLLLEEPELSLHPEIVRRIPQMAARLQKEKPQQVIVSTHSWEMLFDKGIAADEVLLLLPSQEGTEVKNGASIKEISKLMEAGLSAAEAALPWTNPKNINQLTFTF